MGQEAYLRVIYHFSLDCAKIIFGSLVVGLFVPNVVSPTFPLLTFIGGLAATATFLAIAQAALKKIRYSPTEP